MRCLYGSEAERRSVIALALCSVSQGMSRCCFWWAGRYPSENETTLSLALGLPAVRWNLRAGEGARLLLGRGGDIG